MQRNPDAGIKEPKELHYQMLFSMHELGGGPFVSEIFNLLHFPVDVKEKLKWFLLDDDVIDYILDSHDAERILQFVDLARWLWHLPTKSPDLMEKIDPMVRDGIPLKTSGLNATEMKQRRTQLGVWLVHHLNKSLEGAEIDFPEEFLNRKLLASDYVVSGCQRAIRGLFDGNWITPEELTVDRKEGKKMLIWYMTPKARRRLAAWLSEQTGRPVDPVEIRRVYPGQLRRNELLHRVEYTGIAASMKLACTKLGHTWVRYAEQVELRDLLGQPEHLLKYTMLKNSEDPKSGQEYTGFVEPDFLTIIKSNTGKTFAMVWEYDRGTFTGKSSKGHSDFRTKCHRISQLYRSRTWHKVFPECGNSMRYCTIINREGTDNHGNDRLKNHKSIAEEVVREVCTNEQGHIHKTALKQGMNRYWFARKSASLPNIFNPHSTMTILDGAFWERVGNEEKEALIW